MAVRVTSSSPSRFRMVAVVWRAEWGTYSWPQADAVQGPVPAPALHAARQGQSLVVVEHEPVAVHAVAFDVGEQLVGEGLGQWYGAAALLGLGARAVHAVAERRAFDAFGQSLDLAFRQVLGLPFDQDDESVAVAPEFVFGQAQPFALAHAGHEGQHPHEPPGVVGLRGDEVGGLVGRKGGAFLQRHAGRGALDGGLRSMRPPIRRPPGPCAGCATRCPRCRSFCPAPP